jgi:hypothetical protein
MYLFITAVILVQLVEFFIWRNINNKYYNNVFSILAVLLLIIQPILSVMILTNIELRNILLISYSLLVIPYSIYKFSTKNIHSVISKNGHLRWEFFGVSPIILSVWFFFLLFSPIYEKKWMGLIFSLVVLVISIYNYTKENTMGSMWCWGVNSIMIYYAFYLLIYLPFLEKASIC